MMKNEKRKHSQNNQKKAKKQLRIFAGVFIGLCMLIGVICLWFYGQVQKTVREESSGYLKEVVTRIGSNANKIIDNTYSMLISFANTLDQSGAESIADFKSIAVKEKHWGYESVFLIDKDGKAYDVDGKNFILSGEVYLQNVVVKGKQAMSPLQVVNGKECAVFAVPLGGRMFDGVSMVALAVTYDTQVFAKVLSMSAFDNKAYSYIVSKEGTIIIRSDSTASADFGYNIFTSIDNSASVDKKSIMNYKEEIKNNRTGQIEFELNGRREYMVYSPIPPDDWYLLAFVPTEVVNAKSNLLLMATVIMSGIIMVAFAVLSIVMLVSSRKYQSNLEKIAYIDDVTGGNTIERFYELSNEALAPTDHPQYALVYTNISKFKVLNENFGRRVGDEILNKFCANIQKSLSRRECIGRLTADNFCILMEYENTQLLCGRFEQWYSSAVERIAEINPVWSMPITEFGIYVIERDTMPFPQMIDRAKLALQAVPHGINSRLRYAVYNEEVREKLFREKHLEDMMENALINKEFKMYLQPKFRTSDEKIVGAEALSRWESTSEGMIFPNDFIPLFEKNGFIVQLDLWIFEEVCKLISSWMENKEEPIKISVNCSRANIKDRQFVRTYLNIAEKYKVPPHFIEIELTESLVMEDAEYFKRVVREIHVAGFGCSMDDFGSGYSSLNMIKDVDVDTIKIDRIFFCDVAKDSYRTESVVKNIIGMAKALSMETVAEGVEQEEQILMLRRVGCDLIQGYVFAKPMPVEEFLERFKNKTYST